MAHIFVPVDLPQLSSIGWVGQKWGGVVGLFCLHFYRNGRQMNCLHFYRNGRQKPVRNETLKTDETDETGEPPPAVARPVLAPIRVRTRSLARGARGARLRRR